MTKAQARACANAIRAHLDGARVLILDLYERRGWQALGYESWRECVVSEFGQSERRLYQQLEAARIERVVAPERPVGSIPERQLRPLAGLAPAEQKRAFEKAREIAPGGRPTTKHVEAAVAAVAPRPSRSKPAPAPADPRPEPADIAAQRAAGIIPEGVVVVVEEPGPAPADADDEAAEPAEQTPEEYLAECGVREGLSAYCRKIFDRDALLFRLLTPHRRRFHHHAQRALASDRRQGRAGMYHSYVSSFLRKQHPRHWVLCGDCKGSGQVVLVGECPNCHGMGYKVR